jgi:type I site-specific restriction-modification system R (restriction) subunit
MISDEAHRTQAGKLARNMRLALPNAAFLGFTGTPLFKHDELTRRIFGNYMSRYDFKRSEEDGATVKLVYENRSAKLGLARLYLNDRIAEAVERADLDEDQLALLEKLLGKDYEVITADDLLDKIADDFVEHCATRWESGKAIIPRWQAKAARLRDLAAKLEAEPPISDEEEQKKRRDTSDVTELLKELHRIVNEAIRAQQPGDDQAVGLMVDLSRVDFHKLREEFARKVQRKQTALQDIRDLVERKLQQMLRHNPRMMDYYRKYQEIVADYNREKDRATVEQTFAQLLDLYASLDAEEQRIVQEGLSRDEVALFDLLAKDSLSKADREKLKQASRSLLASLLELLRTMEHWTEKEQTQADVRVFILDRLFEALPNPPYSQEETERVADRVYDYIWQRSPGGHPLEPLTAA